MHVGSETLELPFRTVTEEDIKGTRRGTQRYAPDDLYDRALPGLLVKMGQRETKRAEVQGLFLDELANLDLKTQAKLLNFLQDFELARLGSTRTVKVSTRSARHVRLRRHTWCPGVRTAFPD